MSEQTAPQPAGASRVAGARSQRPPEVYETLRWNGWGKEGVQMSVDESGQTTVRYIDGKPLRGLPKFLFEEIDGVADGGALPEFSPSITQEEALAKLNPPIIHTGFMTDLARLLTPDQIRPDGLSRLTHLTGKNYRDLWRVRNGLVERAPDCVLLPNSHDDCVSIVRTAHTHNVALIPFGGGTTVTGGVEANALDLDRMTVSVDMRRMNRLLALDTNSLLATFECGALGPKMDEDLRRHGCMVGHDPDSYIYSTLGGWIGARGSGAMSNQYGDVEQMVVALRVVTPTGVVETPVTSRTCGVDLNGLFIGSEGAFGIITEATIKVEPIPAHKHYGGYLFPTFETAFEAFQTCIRQGMQVCTMRLYDEDDFRLNMAMNTSEHSFFKDMLSRGMKTYLRRLRGWDMRRISLVIVGYEGTPERVAFQRGESGAVFRRFGGVSIGRAAGDGWQAKKYDLPYVRDFALSVSRWADVFETSVLYSDAIPCWRAVKAAVRQVWKEHGRHGWIGCHTAHQYRYGCCLYFTFASSQKDTNDMKIFLAIKRRATEAMLQHSGNLTHHHGIGYEHVPWMTRYMGTGSMSVLYSLKQSMDPKNICNPGKLLPSPRKPGESEEAWRKRQDETTLFDKLGVPGAVPAKL